MVGGGYLFYRYALKARESMSCCGVKRVCPGMWMGLFVLDHVWRACESMCLPWRCGCEWAFWAEQVASLQVCEAGQTVILECLVYYFMQILVGTGTGAYVLPSAVPTYSLTYSQDVSQGWWRPVSRPLGLSVVRVLAPFLPLSRVASGVLTLAGCTS